MKNYFKTNSFQRLAFTQAEYDTAVAIDQIITARFNQWQTANPGASRSEKAKELHEIRLAELEESGDSLSPGQKKGDQGDAFRKKFADLGDLEGKLKMDLGLRGKVMEMEGKFQARQNLKKKGIGKIKSSFKG